MKMLAKSVILLAAWAIATVFAACPTPPSTLNITSIATNDKQESILQCWQLASPFQASSTPGTAGSVNAQLGTTNNTSFGVIPPQFDGGLHNAPAAQWVAFVSGKAVVSLPNGSQTATVYGGKHGLIFAADTADKSRLGHYTRYPSQDNTGIFQIPLAGNKIPDHRVLHDGPCDEDVEELF